MSRQHSNRKTFKDSTRSNGTGSQYFTANSNFPDSTSNSVSLTATRTTASRNNKVLSVNEITYQLQCSSTNAHKERHIEKNNETSSTCSSNRPQCCSTKFAVSKGGPENYNKSSILVKQITRKIATSTSKARDPSSATKATNVATGTHQNPVSLRTVKPVPSTAKTSLSSRAENIQNSHATSIKKSAYKKSTNSSTYNNFEQALVKGDQAPKSTMKLELSTNRPVTNNKAVLPDAMKSAKPRTSVSPGVSKYPPGTIIKLTDCIRVQKDDTVITKVGKAEIIIGP